MKKFFRKLFSPLVITIMVSILEILSIMTLITLLRVWLDSLVVDWKTIPFYIGRIIVTIFEVIFFIKVVNKAENPEYKIPWIIVIFLMPFLAIVLYMFFANHGLHGKDKKIVNQTRKILEEKYRVDKEGRMQFKLDVPIRYRSIFKYLRHMTKMYSSGHNRVTYYKNGEEFFPELVRALKRAKRFIFLEFFIIGEGKWWSEIEEVLLEKAKNGVEVRLLYDDLGSFGILPNNYPKKLRKQGIMCYKFHPFKPLLSGTYNNRDHRKIAVIDNEEAFTGGMNLADEYANTIKRFGYWKDTMVKIEGPAISNLIAIFLQNYDLSSRKISNYDKYLDYDYKLYDEDEGYVFPFGDGPGGYSYNEPIGEENYLQIIDSADYTLWISTPYLIPTYRMMEALKAAAKRDIDVRLFLPGIPDKKLVYWLAKSDFKQLLEAGVKIFIYKPGFNHEKQIVADEKLAFCGTINFDFRSLTHHFECGVTMYDCNCIKDMVDDFKEMEAQSEELKEAPKMNVFVRIIASIIKIFRTLL